MGGDAWGDVPRCAAQDFVPEGQLKLAYQFTGGERTDKVGTISPGGTTELQL